MSIFTDDFLLGLCILNLKYICIEYDADPNIYLCVGLLDRVFHIVFQTYPDFMRTTYNTYFIVLSITGFYSKYKSMTGKVCVLLCVYCVNHLCNYHSTPLFFISITMLIYHWLHFARWFDCAIAIVCSFFVISVGQGGGVELDRSIQMSSFQIESR